MSVTTKFVTTTSEKLDTISVVNGQVIALSDRDAWFYDMGSTRHMIASNAYVTSLPATGAENTLYVLAAANGDSGLYIYDGSAFVKIAGLKATSATQDSAGNTINTTYVKSVTAEKSGSTVTFTVTKGDDSTSTFTVTDTDTTYDPMTAATADAAGKEGLVPAPAAGDQGKFLAGNATWQEAVTPSGAQALTNKTYEGYTLGNASEKTVAATVGEGGTGLPTAGAVYTALQSILDDAKDYTDTAISGVVQFNIEVVSALPTSDIKTHTIYLVPNGESEGSNVKTEYLYINDSWEIIGSTDIDLTPYVEIGSLKSKGNATTPVYFDANGTPVAISFSVNKTVPADAVFTDTTYDPSDSNPAMDGTASAGSSDEYSRGDHVHPTDTSRAAAPKQGTTDPTTSTIGEIGQIYVNTEDETVFFCTAISGNEYTWTQGGSGGVLTLDRIYVDTEPTKKTYAAGETFDAAGMVIKGDYSISGATVITGAVLTNYTFSPSGALTTDVTSITISVTENGITQTTIVTGIVVEKTSVTKPTWNNAAAIVYDGNNHEPVINNEPASSIATKSGDTSKINANDIDSNPYAIVYTLTNTDYYEWADGSTGAVTVEWAIDKATPNVTAPTAKSGIMYDGSAHVLIDAGRTTGGTLQYSLDNSSWSTSLPEGTNAGSYTVYYKVVGDSNYNDVAAASVQATIGTYDITITAKAQTITYGDSISTGTDQVTVSNLASGDTLDSITLTPNTSDVTTNGTITPSDVVIKRGSENVTSMYNITYATGKLTINKADASVTTPPTAASDLAYTGNAQNLLTSKGKASGGTMQFSLDGSSYSETIPQRTNANTSGYTVYYKVIGDSNHNDSESQTLTVPIAKATPNVTAPTKASDMTWNGSSRALTATAGSTDFGTLEYSIDNSSWSTTRPTASDAGDYVVRYRVTGDDNVNSVASTSIGTVKINKANASVTTAPTAKTLTYSGSAQALINAGTASGGEMQYSTDGTSYNTTIPTGTKAQSYTVYYKVVGDKNHNDVAAAQVSNVKINQASAKPSISKTTMTLDATTKSDTFTVTRAGTGTIVATSSDTTKATVSVNQSMRVVTVTEANNASSGSANITITVQESSDGNYAAYTDTDVVCAVTISLVPDKTFTDATDEELVAMLAAHYNGEIDIGDYWSVGQTRKISLSTMANPNTGVSGTSNWSAQDITLVIVDVNHHDLATSINGVSKAAITVQCRECLNSTNNYNHTDSMYVNGDSAYDKTFTAWKSLLMRTWLNGTFKSAISSETLRNAIKPIKHNTLTTNGSSSTAAEEVTDDIFLPSYPEVFGNTAYSYYCNNNSNPESIGEGTQLEYFKTASNRIKYRNNNGKSTGTACHWWEGSPSSCYDSSNGYRWCSVGTGGLANYYYGGSAFGLAPAFCL